MLGNGILEVEIEIRHLKESHLSHKQCSLSFRFKLYGTHQVEVCWCNSPTGGMGRGTGRQRTKACEGEWLCGREKCWQRSSGSLELQRRRDKALHPVPSPLRAASEGRQPPPMPQEACELSTDPPFLLIKSKTSHCHAAGDIKDCVTGYKAIRNMTRWLIRRGGDWFLRCQVIDLRAVELIKKKKRVVLLILADYSP